MNSKKPHFLIIWVLPTLLFFTFLNVYGAEKEPVHPGDLVLVSVQKAELQVESQVVAELPLGAPVRVSVVKGDWLLDWDLGGWIHRNDVWTAPESERFFAVEIKQRPTASAYHNHGLGHYAAGHYEEAISDFSKALTFEPRNAAVYNSRGSAWQKKDDLEKALEDFSKAIELDSKKSLYWVNRSAAWTLKGDMKQAWEDADRAVELAPKNAAALNTRGSCWYEKGSFKEAAADFDRAIELAPFYAVAFSNRAALYAEQKDYPAALKDYNKAVQLDPVAAEPRNDLAWFLLNCEDESLRDARRAVKLAEEACIRTRFKDWNMLHTLALAYARTDESEKALTTLGSAKK